MNTKVSNSDIKTKTLKESKEEIDKILEKLERLNLKDLESSIKDLSNKPRIITLASFVKEEFSIF